MRGRIITARHGRPNISRDVVISAREYGDWWARYDESGLHPDERPPARLVSVAQEAATVLSSTLPRAIETAAWVTDGKREVVKDQLFVEAPLPPPPLPFLRLRPGQWGVISRGFWTFGYAPGGIENHREAWDRVEAVIDRLSTLTERGDVVLCAHGYLNWMIDQRMSKRSWRRVAHDGGNHYWSSRIYQSSAR